MIECLQQGSLPALSIKPAALGHRSVTLTELATCFIYGVPLSAGKHGSFRRALAQHHLSNYELWRNQDGPAWMIEDLRRALDDNSTGAPEHSRTWANTQDWLHHWRKAKPGDDLPAHVLSRRVQLAAMSDRQAAREAVNEDARIVAAERGLNDRASEFYRSLSLEAVQEKLRLKGIAFRSGLGSKPVVVDRGSFPPHSEIVPDFLLRTYVHDVIENNLNIVLFSDAEHVDDVFDWSRENIEFADVRLHWHEAADFLEAVAPIRKGGKPTAAAEKQCYRWLKAEMTKSPDHNPTGKHQWYLDACERNPKLGSRNSIVPSKAFQRAWDKAVEETGARWNEAGRKPSKKSNRSGSNSRRLLG